MPQGVLSYSQNSLSSFSLFHPSYAEIKHMQLLKMSVVIVQAIKGFAGVQSKICSRPTSTLCHTLPPSLALNRFRTVKKPEEKETS